MERLMDILFFTHGLLEKQVFSFYPFILVFILVFRLVRKLVFLYFNVNVYLKEIPCLNKVTLAYLTLPHISLVPDSYILTRNDMK